MATTVRIITQSRCVVFVVELNYRQQIVLLFQNNLVVFMREFSFSLNVLLFIIYIIIILCFLVFVNKFRDYF